MEVLKSKQEFERIIPEIDRQIRSGQHLEAKVSLETLLSSKVPRPWAAQIAALARRLSLSEISLQLLRPYVRPAEKKKISASPAELAEYAAALIRVGVIGEAHRLLDQVAIDAYPRALLYRAFAFISHWNFAAIQAPLEAYIANPKAEPYEKLIAKVNLLVGFVFLENFKASDKLAQELIHETGKSGSNLLLANTLEMAAENFINQKRWNQARSMIEQASQLVKNSETIDAYFIRKQQAILNLKQYRRPADFVALENLRGEAIERKHWESVRDCDFHLACCAPGAASQKLFKHLYFGTPYVSFKEKVQRKAGWVKPPEKFERVLSSNPDSKKGTAGVDIFSVGKTWPNLPHKLLLFLSQDAYRPRRGVEVFDALYGNDYYDRDSSGARIRQVMKRLRQLMRKEGLPLTVKESLGSYQLAAASKRTGTIHTKIRLTHVKPEELRSLKAEIATQDFWKEFSQENPAWYGTAKELANEIDRPLRSTQRLLKAGDVLGLVEKCGSNRQVKYRIHSTAKQNLRNAKVTCEAE